MVKYDVSRVGRDLLNRMAEALIVSTHVEFQLIEDIREAATVKFRSKAEIDADIAKAVRDYVTNNSNNNRCQYMAFDSYTVRGGHIRFNEVIDLLLSEETSD